MSGPSISTSETKAEALTLQSSAYGVTVAVVGGVAKVGGNMLDYQDFKAIPRTETQGGKGGATSSSTTYTYAVSAAMALCHGRIQAGRVWKGKEVMQGGPAAGAILRASGTWTPPAIGAAALTLPNGANRIGQVYLTGNGAPLSDGVDYFVRGSTLTLRNEAWRGKALAWAHQYTAAAVTNAGLGTLGLSLKDGDEGQTPMSWMQAAHPERALNYPGMAYVHGQDIDLGRSPSVENHVVEVFGFGAHRYGAGKPDCNLAEFAAYLLANGDYGAAIPAGRLDVSAWVNYCAASGLLMSPALTTQMRAGDFLRRACELTNSQPVVSYDRIIVQPLADSPVSDNGATFTPNATPIYDLTDDCWIGDTPLTWTRKEPSDRYNSVRVEFNDRANYYNRAICDVQDDAEVALYGKRAAPTIVAPWITTSDVARRVGQLALQRFLAINGTGRCRLPWAYCLLEPGDLVTLTDARLKFDKFPARVTKVSRDASRRLSVEFEEWPIGAATATAYQTDVPGGYKHNYYVSPGSADAPVIFEGPAQLAGTTGLELWVAVRGASPNWGGAEVHVSLDGNEYRLIGTVWGGARYGTLNGAMYAYSTAMNVDGLTVGALNNASAIDAQNLQTLCFVGGAEPEFLAYTTATLTAAGAYTLAGLVRGAYASPAASHPNGAPFVRMDDACARSGPLDLTMVGQTVRVKVLSFNIYGRAVQTLADVPAYSYTITGKAASFMPGVAGKGVALNASALMFTYPKGGGVTPGSITLTASRKGALQGAISFAVVAGSATLVGSGDARTLAPGDMLTDTVTVRASCSDGVSVYTADQTITKVRDGTDGAGGVTWTCRGVTQTGGTFTKTGGGDAWNADAYSNQAFPGGAYVSCTMPAADKTLMVGINIDPATDTSYSSIDYAFHPQASGALLIYESGNYAAGAGTYQPGDRLMVRYLDLGAQGGRVDYIKNGSIVRTVGVASGLVMYADSSLYSVGAQLNDMVFGPIGAAGPQGPQGLPGADGASGGYTDYVFRRAASQPATPTGIGTPAGWSDAPPAGADPLWMSSADKTASGALVNGWSVPIRLDGPAGADGSDGASVTVEYSINGSTGWHSVFAAGDLYMRQRVGAGAWSAAIRIVGEQGLPGADGANGASAPLLVLTCTAQTFAFDGANAPLPAGQTITFTANLQNLSGTATFACMLYNASGQSLGSVTLGGSGNNRTLTVAQFGSAQYASVTITLAGLSDTATLVRIRDGASNVTADLTNDRHTLMADSAGNVLSYSGASTQMKVWEGLQLASGWTFSKVDPTGITTSIAGPVVTVTAMDANTEKALVRINATKAGFPDQALDWEVTKMRGAPNAVGPISGWFAWASDVHIGAPASTSATLKVRNDGRITGTRYGQGQPGVASYYLPNTAGVGSNYWVRAVKTSGDTPTGSPLNQWIQCSTEPQWTVSKIGQGWVGCDLQLTFATASDGSGQVARGLATIEGEYAA